MLTFLPDIDSTVVIIAAFPNQSKAVKLIEELDSLNDLKLEYAITSLIIANCENTFFSPLFWNSLTKKEKRKLLDEFIADENLQFRNKFFKSSFNFFDEKYEISNLKRAAANIVLAKCGVKVKVELFVIFSHQYLLDVADL